jgi:HlyD family secretion protein
MTASITFILEEHKDVIVVPTRALRYRPPDADELDPPGGKQAAPKKNKSKKGSGAAEGVVWVLRDGKPSPVQVQPGLTDGQNTEVVGGEIREGDMIITGVEGKAKGKRKGKKDRPAGDSAQ